MSAAILPLLTPNDFSSDREVRWCPGCGDFSILSQLKKVLAVLGVPRENLVFVSGLGCAGRLPYYLSTYGFHGSYGRGPAPAAGGEAGEPEPASMGCHGGRRRPFGRRESSHSCLAPERRFEDPAFQQRGARSDQ